MSLLTLLSFISLFAYVNSYSETIKNKSSLQAERLLPYAMVKERFFGEWKLETSLESFNEGEDESVIAGFSFSPDINYRLTSDLMIVTGFKIQMVSRQIQSRFYDGRTSGLLTRNAYLSYYPDPLFKFDIGILDLKNKEYSILTSWYKSFPGAREEIGLNYSKGRVYLRSSQMIPTSESFDSDRAEKEKLPEFYVNSIGFYHDFNSSITVDGYLGNYKFSELPSVVAFNSDVLGNTVLGSSKADSKFAFDFAGYLAGFGICYCGKGYFGASFSGAWVENQKSDSTYNQAQLMKFSLDLNTSQFVFSPFVGSFFIESDVSPGAYQSSHSGNSNRIGNFYGMDWVFKDYHFKIVGQYREIDPINFDPDQDHRQDLLVKLETLNVAF